MKLIVCSICNQQVSETSMYCPYCKAKFTNEDSSKNFSQIVQTVRQSNPLKVKSRMFRRLSWYILANFAIVTSLSVLSAGALLKVAPFFLIISCFFPFVILLLSRWLAKRSHHIRIIKKGQYTNKEDVSLYELIETLSQRARIKKTPQVGIYESEEVNAFATGASRNRSLVAFSSALIETMDEEGIAAVAAHEIAHVANGDMVTMALVQSVVNALVYLITLPLSIIQWIAIFSDQVSVAASVLISILRFLVSAILFFLGSLVVKAFSRNREFKADRLAAQLLRKESMIHALEQLRDEEPVVLKSQRAYAALKINSPSRWLDLFSTHPSIDRRIRALQKLNSNNR